MPAPNVTENAAGTAQDPKVIADHLEALRKRLIDLSNRNKLVNFRATKKSCIEVAFPAVSDIFRTLIEDDKTFKLQPGVEYITGGIRSRRKKSGVASDPVEISRQESAQAQQKNLLPCRYDEAGVESRADYIRREAKAILDETGINHLYLALGFLRWRERKDSEEERQSPLLLIPVIISRNSGPERAGTRQFTIAHDGGELFPNLSLIERLRQDFALELPRFGEDSTDAEEYLADVARTVRGRTGWGVEESAFISFFSFAKLRMYIDLDPKHWPEGRSLLTNDLVRSILEGSLDDSEQTGYGSVEVHDDHATAHSIPLVVEADSSQHTAILKTWEGRNQVIEGPPGTGKSQTITNIIASALHQGKTVLFISEKLAALEVVKRNLDSVGLGEFCLELHSHKTRKQEVHASMGRRIRWQAPRDNRFALTLRAWRLQVAELKQYLEACGRCLGPRTEQVFRILGRAIYLREKPIPAIRDPLDRLEIDTDRFDGALACLRQIAAHLQNPAEFRNHPWAGFLAENTRAGDELVIEREFEALAKTLEEGAKIAREFEMEVGLETCPSPSFIAQLTGLSSSALPELSDGILKDILPNLICNPNSVALAEVIDRSRGRDAHIIAACETLSPGAIERGGLGEWLRDASEIAVAQRLGAFEIAFLQSKLPSLAEVSDLTATAVRVSEDIAGLGLGSPATAHDLKRYLDRLQVCGSAVEGIDRLLCAEHRFPNAETVLSGARDEADRLCAERKELEVIFESADAPDSTGVQELKKRLRSTGGQWLSIFNREYRDGRRAVRAFLRSRKHFTFPGIVDALERLEQWCKRAEDFQARPDLARILGPGFSGLKTDWAALAASVSWSLAMTRESFSWSTIEKIAQPENQGKVRELTTTLDATLKRLHVAFSDAELVLNAILDGRPHQATEIRDLARIAREWTNWLRQTLDSVFPVSTSQKSTFQQLKVAAEHVIEAERLAASIVADKKFAEIAGQHARGLESDWNALAATKEWVEAIRSLALPPPLFAWLMNEAASNRLPVVKKVIERLSSVTVDCSGTITRMEMYGTIQRDWLWGEGHATWEGRKERCRSLKAKCHLLQQWALFRTLYRRAEGFAANFAVDEVLNGTVSPDDAHEAFDLAVNEFYGYEVLRTYRELETFTHDSRQHLLESFRNADRELLEHARVEVAQRAADRRPPGGIGVGPIRTWTEMALLRNQVNNTRHIPIRQLMLRAGRAVVSWKPCLMMSPLSVAQFLDPKCEPFDLVVMDEASQIRPEDALGAVARAKQIVVVGDTKQMPPSEFWTRTINDDEEDDDDEGEEKTGRSVAQDSESILECAKNAFPPAQRLLWHYRSQHESLIRFSNYAYYDEELIVFPAPNDDAGKLGIKFRHIPEGRYKTGARVNEIEAEFVARAALHHLVEYPSESLLVATFNRTQQDLIDQLVEKYAIENEATFERLEEARSHPKEPFAVKNLENVQGDERDVIYVSCTYGPDINTGIVNQRFGPITGAGGRRRLNVLFTRAKRRMELFSSMTHDQILGRPGELSGINDLRDYLRFAQTGILSDRGQVTGQSPDSYFEEAVMRVVESTGLRAVPQVGVSSYRIDIGVEHPSRPGEFILGIECDGAMYHSSRSARDRDRLRQEVLERRGWNIHRVWSTDWFRQNKAARERLVAVLHKASIGGFP